MALAVSEPASASLASPQAVNAVRPIPALRLDIASLEQHHDGSASSASSEHSPDSSPSGTARCLWRIGILLSRRDVLCSGCSGRDRDRDSETLSVT